MRITNEIVVRANARTIEDAIRRKKMLSDKNIESDGSFYVSVRYGDSLISQKITPQQLKSSFAKALSDYGSKISQDFLPDGGERIGYSRSYRICTI